jgi:hypothetical protein
LHNFVCKSNSDDEKIFVEAPWKQNNISSFTAIITNPGDAKPATINQPKHQTNANQNKRYVGDRKLCGRKDKGAEKYNGDGDGAVTPRY